MKANQDKDMTPRAGEAYSSDLQVNDQILDQLLQAMPPADVSPDFTERVLAGLQRFDLPSEVAEEKTKQRLWLRWITNRHWLQSAALFAVIVALSAGTYMQHSKNAQQQQLQRVASSIQTIADTAEATGAIHASDLTAIQTMQSLTESSAADNDLWFTLVSY